LALLSKENAVALPLILTLFEVIRPDGASRGPASVSIKRLLPTYLLLAVYFVWRFSIVPHSSTLPAGEMELMHRLLTAARAVVSYAYVMLFPHNIGFETFIPISTSSTILEGMCAAAFLILMLALAALILRISRRVSFFILWFFLCLLPFSYFFLFHPEPAFFTPPHFLYFPSMGIVALWGLGIANTAQATPPESGAWRRRALIVSQVVIIFLFCVSAVRRNALWRDERTFFSAMKKYAPGSPRIRIGMANVLLDAGQSGPALAEYGKAYELARRPEKVPPTAAASTGRIIISNYYAGAALAGMGDAHLMMGETLQSIESYERAARENAFDATIHLRLAHACELAGRFDDAVEGYERALRLDKRLREASARLEIARAKRDVYEQAEQVYESAQMYGQQGSAEALYGEAVMLRLSGREEAAAALLRQALENEPAHFGANLALGQILSERGDHVAAFGYYSAAFAARPDSALTARELAITSLALRDTLMAELWAAKAYDLEPDEFYERFLEGMRREARRQETDS
ncbi:MAG: hypothetical protein C4532_15095, partial [Candidatus Abyssobacteria bacterium SURF_17]